MEKLDIKMESSSTVETFYYFIEIDMKQDQNVLDSLWENLHPMLLIKRKPLRKNFSIACHPDFIVQLEKCNGIISITRDFAISF